eukprot:gene1412-12032_t
MKRGNGEEFSPLKKYKLSIDPDSNLDLNVLQEQKNHLKVKVEEQKREITTLKTELLMLKKQKENSDCSVGIINRYWNNLDDDLEIILQKIKPQDSKLNGHSKKPLDSKNFIQRLLSSYDSSIREEETSKIENGLKQRCDKTKNVLKLLLEAIATEKEHNFEISEKLKTTITYEDIKQSNDNLQNQNEKLNELLDSMQIQVRNTTNENNMAKDDVTKLQITIKDLTNELDSTKFDLSHANKTIDRLKLKGLNSPTSTPLTPMTPFDSSQTSFVDDKIVDKLKKDIEQRRVAYDQITNDFINVQQENVSLKIEIGRITRELHSDTNIFSSRQFQVLGHKLDETRKELDYFRNSINQYKKDINDLENSKSSLYYQIHQKEEKKQNELMEEIQKKDKELMKIKNDFQTLKVEFKNTNISELNFQCKRLSKLAQEQQLKIEEYKNIFDKQKELLVEPKKMIILQKTLLRKTKELEKFKKNQNEQEQEEEKDIDLQEQVILLKEECETYLEELDSVSASFDEIQNKNANLNKQLSEKDDKNAKLIHEKLLNSQAIQLKETEISTLKSQIDTLNKLISQLEENVTHLKSQLQIKDEQYFKITEENRLTQTVLEKKNRIANESLQNLNECKQEMNKLQVALSDYQKRLYELESMLIAEQAKTKKLSLEYDVLLKRLNLGKLDSQEENLRKEMTCGICQTRKKDTIITRCFHTFCGECIQDSIRVRNRKCAVCGLKYGDNDVHEFFL